MKSFKGLIIVTVIVIAGCSPASDDTDTQRKSSGFMQRPDDLVAGEVMAVAYSGFREGQHPDRGDGAVNPSDDEILEDLEILLAHDFKLIRLYDSGENSLATLELIRQHDLPIKVLLGMWLRAEFSNHLGCPKRWSNGTTTWCRWTRSSTTFARSKRQSISR
jgi:hypothetical protein